jgi:hypothetical protein
MFRNYCRNQTLIDLTKIPEHLITEILHTYENAVVHSKQNFLNYMIANRLKNLIETMDDF